MKRFPAGFFQSEGAVVAHGEEFALQRAHHALD